MLDLTDAPRRQALFAQLGRECRNGLVVTEGLLIYLDPAQVAALARDLHAATGFHWWLIDLGSPMLLNWSARSWGKELERGNAPFKFGPEENTKFFEPHGWREAVYRGIADEALRLNRAMRGMRFWKFIARLYPKRLRKKFERFSGIVLFERA
jgi:O-methyltransferase involved in polyketide biosynthesis